MALKRRLGELLIAQRLITNEQLDHALEVQRETHETLGAVLVTLGYLDEPLLLKAMAAQKGVRPWDLTTQPPKPYALGRVPENICRTYQLLPVEAQADLLIVAMRNPDDLEALELVRNITGMRIEPVLADEDKLLVVIDQVQNRSVGTAVGGFVAQAMGELDSDAPIELENLEVDEDDRPVVALVNTVLTEAIRLGASDVHIEPRGGRVDIRFRVDGEMRKIQEIPSRLLPMLIARMKIMAELDIVEFRLPQDGRISVKIDGRVVDIRVAVLPNYHGQRLVMRILDKSVSLKRLPELGFSTRNLAMFRKMIEMPHGMVLVTGPTGSGKTTTLYAAIAELRSPTRNIMTCEDPVEYDLDGISQSQVNEKVGLTFAKQLRATLRQDPDMILVGEIRDQETVQTAIRAALTGHMLLSTLHCNDAPSAIPRLLDMGVDPFMLSTSLTGVISQRLTRVLCSSCSEERHTSDEERSLFTNFLGYPVETVRDPRGCPYCAHTGYRGRQALQEILPVTRDVAHAIASRVPMDTVRELAVANGYEPMQRMALEMVASGVTSLEEIRRKVSFDLDSEILSIANAAPMLRAA
ncbi:MAG: GspE/PulE family protein [Fimbriimonadaceae bacterium]|nr:GspE/PulE family protein [Fimbriimonadaceae bacterium]